MSPERQNIIGVDMDSIDKNGRKVKRLVSSSKNVSFDNKQSPDTKTRNLSANQHNRKINMKSEDGSQYPLSSFFKTSRNHPNSGDKRHSDFQGLIDGPPNNQDLTSSDEDDDASFLK